MSDKPLTIFYSWQSWQPRSRNLDFIQDALDAAKEQIEQSYNKTIIIERDTRGLPGMPPIADAILEKIDKSDIFVGDITAVTTVDSNDVPNPNVLLEFGYAVKSLSWNRIILVMNTEYSQDTNNPHKSLFFDVAHRRGPIIYRLKEGQIKAPVKDKLVKDFINAITLILDSVNQDVYLNTIQSLENLIEQGQIPTLERKLREQIEIVYSKIDSDTFRQEIVAQSDLHPYQSPQMWEACFQLYFENANWHLRFFYL
jgi:hypothetical protein